MVSTANAANEPLRVRSVFDINSVFCAIKTNGVLGMDNRDSAFEVWGFGTASTNALLLLENGWSATGTRRRSSGSTRA